MNFMRRDDLPVLLQIAIAHAQFETISPVRRWQWAHGTRSGAGIGRNKRLATHNDGTHIGGSASSPSIAISRRSPHSGPATRHLSSRASPMPRALPRVGAALVDSPVDELDRSSEQMVGVRRDAAARRLLPLLIGQPVVNAGYVQQHLVSMLRQRSALCGPWSTGTSAERTGYARATGSGSIRGSSTRWIPTPRTSGEVACRAESVLLVRILR